MMTIKRDKPVQRLMFLRPEQLQALDDLSTKTRVQRAVLVREAVDDLLKKYQRKGGDK